MPEPLNKTPAFRPSIIITLVFGVVAIVIVYFLSTRAGGGMSIEQREPTKVYFADNISSAHRLIIAEFNRRHAGSIEVVPVDLPFDKFSTNERKELLTRSLRSKSDKIDVFAVDLIWVPRFARWAEPLDHYFDQADQLRLLSYSVQSCRFEDRLVAMPMYLDVGLLYYRKDIIGRLPDAAAVEHELEQSISWDRLLQLRRRLGYEHRPFYVFQAKDYEGLVCNLLELAVQQDPNFKSEAALSSTAAPLRKALETLVQFVRGGVSPREVTEFDENMSYRYMLDNDAVFVRGWPNFVENFRAFYADSVKLGNIGRAPLPHVNGQLSASVFGGWNLMVSKSSANKEAAVEFIRFLQSEEIQHMMFEEGGYIPVINSVYRDTAFLNHHTELAFYRTILQNGFHRPALVDYTRLSDILSHYANLAIEGDISVDEALVKADAMIRSTEVLVK